MSMKQHSPNRIQIYDTTLRDGTQREGISFSCQDKIRIAQRLDEFGFSFIEGGWPGSNPKDAEFFERARDIDWKTAAITAFGSTRRANSAPEEDQNLNTLLEAGTSTCTVFGKTWTLHVEEVLRASLDENLAMIEDSVSFLRSNKREVIYDAEHFFDGYRADPSYALETLKAAKRGGASVLVLCDTNGGSLPWDIEDTVREVAQALKHPVGIHAHNDTECAVANSLAAVRGGARHIQGTINGYGERCGNANLCSLIPNLELKLEHDCLGKKKLEELQEVSRFVTELANLGFDEHLPYVGRSAFAHKGGVHVAAMRRSQTSYQHIEPELVGNSMRTVVSELSGRGNLLSKAEEHGLSVGDGLEVEVLKHIKECEAKGYSFEAAEASVTLLLKRKDPSYQAPFWVQDYEVTVGKRRGIDTYAEATVKVVVGDEVQHAVADGDGPVGALDAALRKALQPVLPEIEQVHLSDYKVRILDGSDGTSATTRVLIDSSDGHNTWSTVGASPNIIQASLRALIDGMEYGLMNLAKLEQPQSDNWTEEQQAAGAEES